MPAPVCERNTRHTPGIHSLAFALLLLFAMFARPIAAGETVSADTETVEDGEEKEEEERLSAEDIPLPLARAQVGDWAEYKTAEGGTMRLTVVERWSEHGDDHLVIQASSARKRSKKSRRKPSFEQISIKDHMKEIRDLGPEDFVTRSTVLVNGERVHCVVVNYVEGGRVVRQSYISDSVPVYGLVRGVTNQGREQKIALRLDTFDYADFEEGY